MPVLTTVENVQDQIIETIGSVQTRVIKTNKKIAGQFNDKVADRVPAMPALPLLDTVTDRIPAPSVAVGTYFDLVERATKANRKFAMDLVKVWAPSKKAPVAKTAAKKAPAAKTAAKKAPVAKKRAARKSTARKTTARKTAS